MTKYGKPEGKVAIVTGAARGIGAATAIALAKRAMASVLAVRNAETAQGTAEGVRRLGVPCRVEVCDVADYAAVRSVVERTLESWSRIDAVINNAAQIDPIGGLASTDPREWSRAVSVNLIGSYNVIRAALPALLMSGCGAIVNVSTGAAHSPRLGWSAYCSSKAALAMLTRCVAEEYSDEKIVAYGLQPGLIDTDMQARIRASGINQISLIPRDRLASPERAANVLAWLADETPNDLSGRELSLNDPEIIRRAQTTATRRE